MTNTLPTSRQVEVLAIVKQLAFDNGSRGVTASEVARKLEVTRHAAVKLLHQLEAKGLIADVPIEVSSGQWRVTHDGNNWLPAKKGTAL